MRPECRSAQLLSICPQIRIVLERMEIDSLQGGRLDAHYLGYFECFNRQQFFEAHEVLEELWLSERGQPRDLFYKGLIQLAGAFVHIQKQRPKPALALFRLAAQNLGRYPRIYESLDTVEIQKMIDNWQARLENDSQFFEKLNAASWPQLSLS